MHIPAIFLMKACQLLEHKKHKIQQSPAYKGPVGAMPYTGQEPHDKYIPYMPSLTHPVSAKGYLDIVPEPGAECDMPSSPELCYGLGHIRKIEVFKEMEAEHPSKPDCHIRIS